MWRRPCTDSQDEPATLLSPTIHRPIPPGNLRTTRDRLANLRQKSRLAGTTPTAGDAVRRIFAVSGADDTIGNVDAQFYDDNFTAGKVIPLERMHVSHRPRSTQRCFKETT